MAQKLEWKFTCDGVQIYSNNFKAMSELIVENYFRMIDVAINPLIYQESCPL